MRVMAWPAFINKPANPYNWLMYTYLKEIHPEVSVEEFSPFKLIFSRYDILHMHWPESILNDSNKLRVIAKFWALVIILIWAKFRRTKLIWTVHNLDAHERFYLDLEKQLKRFLISRLNGIITLTESGLDLTLKKYPKLSNIPLAVIPHGHYCGYYLNKCNIDVARERLGVSLSDKVILFVGQIRPYKNVLVLVEKFKKLPGKNIKLIIAGKPNSNELKNKIEVLSQGDSRIQLHLTFIADEELQVFLNAADIVVLPYQEILNSGSAILALSFGKQILVPEKGSMGELKETFDDNYVKTYRGELSSKILDEVLCEMESSDENTQEIIFKVQDKLDWCKIAQKTLDFYKTFK